MAALVIAIGNPMRGDDGAAHRVLDVLGARTGVERRAVMQLTPEIAEEIGSHDAVVFVDADVSVTQTRIDAVGSMPCPSTLTHVSRPAEIVALARILFGFSGPAYVCRLPATDFSERTGLSPSAEGFVHTAAREIDRLLSRIR